VAETPRALLLLKVGLQIGVEAKLTVFTVEVEAVATALEAIKAQEAEAVVAFNLEGLKLQRKSL